MSLSASMWTGVSGLLAHGEKMNVVGNNLANVSTVGFRGQRMDFADFVYANTYTSAGTGQIGRGVKVGAIMGNFAQGSFETTTNATDLAISGSGFFKVNKIGKDQGFYTRAGNFSFNSEGYLVDPNGYALQGWMVDNTGGISRASGGLNPDSVTSQDTSDIIGSGTPTDIKLDTWTVFPQQTTNMTFKVNLPSASSDHARSNTNPFASLMEAWNGTQPQGSENTPYIASSSYASSTTLTVYDEAGSKHTVSIYYDKVDKDDVEGLGNNSMWEYIVTMDPAEDQRQYWDDAAGELRNVNETKMGGVLASGTITFDAAGRMTNQSCYTWGGSQSPDTNPNSFTEVPDPTNPLNSLQVINLDPTDLNNWYPAEISSNGYPIVVANFSGVLDAQTSGSTNGERYGIELNFGVKVGNFDAPWENTASLGSLAVTPYAQNGAGKSPEYYEINPDYDPKAPWDDRNHYQWKFKGVDYGTPGTAAGDAALLSAIQSMYGNIPVTSGRSRHLCRCGGRGPAASARYGVLQYYRQEVLSGRRHPVYTRLHGGNKRTESLHRQLGYAAGHQECGHERPGWRETRLNDSQGHLRHGCGHSGQCQPCSGIQQAHCAGILRLHQPEQFLHRQPGAGRLRLRRSYQLQRRRERHSVRSVLQRRHPAPGPGLHV